MLAADNRCHSLPTGRPPPERIERPSRTRPEIANEGLDERVLYRRVEAPPRAPRRCLRLLSLSAANARCRSIAATRSAKSSSLNALNNGHWTTGHPADCVDQVDGMDGSGNLDLPEADRLCLDRRRPTGATVLARLEAEPRVLQQALEDDAAVGHPSNISDEPCRVVAKSGGPAARGREPEQAGVGAADHGTPSARAAGRDGIVSLRSSSERLRCWRVVGLLSIGPWWRENGDRSGRWLRGSGCAHCRAQRSARSQLAPVGSYRDWIGWNSADGVDHSPDGALLSRWCGQVDASADLAKVRVAGSNPVVRSIKVQVRAYF